MFEAIRKVCTDPNNTGMPKTAFLKFLVALAALVWGQAHSAVPALGTFNSVSIGGFGFQSSGSLGSLTAANSFGTATAVAGTLPAPFVSVYVNSSDASLGAHNALADAQLQYFLRVNGPVGTQVPVRVTASGSMTHSDINAFVSASLKMIHFGIGTLLIDEKLCWLHASCGAPTPDSFSLNAIPIMLNANALYAISLQAQANAATAGDPSNGGFASVFVDPYFEIDPQFAAASNYALEFSAGIVQAPVPEPQTWAMLLAGMGLVGWRAARGKV